MALTQTYETVTRNTEMTIYPFALLAILWGNSKVGNKYIAVRVL